MRRRRKEEEEEDEDLFVFNETIGAWSSALSPFYTTLNVYGIRPIYRSVELCSFSIQ